MIIIRCLFVFSILTVATAHADTGWKISGSVRDSATKQSLAGVTVSVEDHEAWTTLTEDDGTFTIEPEQSGNYRIVASMLGATEPAKQNIVLDESHRHVRISFLIKTGTVLPEIIVSADRNPDRVGKSILKGEEIRKVAGSSGDPLRSLQTLPGVASSNFSSAPAVRGSGPGDNFYYADGIPLNKLFHFGGISVFNGDLIEDFNLYSAAFAPSYDNVTGAILDVALRKPRTDRVGGKVNVSLTGADFIVEGPVSENQSAYFAARRSYVDLLIRQIKRNGVTVQIPNYWDYQGKYLWQVNGDNRFTFYANAAADSLKLEIDSSSDIGQTQPVLAGEINAQDAGTTQAVVWHNTLSANASNRLVAGHRTNYSHSQIASAGTVQVDVEALYLREQLRLKAAEHHDLTLSSNMNSDLVALDLSVKNTNCTQFNTGCDLSTAPTVQLKDSIRVLSWDISAQDRWRFADRFILIGGVRHSTENYLNRSYTEPRLGLEWEWSEKTLLSAGWGKHNQMPTGQQVARNFGNPNLSHIRADHSVLGIAHKMSDIWSWKSEVYYKKFSDLVVGVSDTNINYVNGASGAAYGFELLIKKEPVEDLSGWLSVTLAKSERRNDLTGENFRFAYDQPVNVSWITQYKLNDNWTMGSKWTYTSGRPYTPITGTNGTYSDGRPIPVYAPINSGTLPDFHRLDIRFDREYRYDGWKLNVYYEINNAYFRKNIVGYNYGPNYDKQEPVEAFVIPFSFGVQGEF